jgi:hypothetical protein
MDKQNEIKWGKYFFACLSLLFLWHFFSQVFVLEQIERVYNEQSLPLLNSILKGRSIHPLSYYLGMWEQLAFTVSVMITMACMFIPLTQFLSRSTTYFERFVGPATPGTIGVIRAFICTFLFGRLFWQDLPSTALLPREAVEPVKQGMIQYLSAVPGFDGLMASYSELFIFQNITAIFLFLGVIGLWSRITVPVAGILYLIAGGIIRGYAWGIHQDVALLYMIAVLSFSPCGHGFSIDRLIRKARGLEVPPADRAQIVYGWTRYALWAVLATIYLAAALSKLRYSGLAWLGSDTLLATMLEDTLSPMAWDISISLFLAQNAPAFVFTLMGLYGLILELVYCSVLFSPRARKIMPLLAVGLHLGILMNQNILFGDLVIIQSIFYDWTPLRKWISRKFLSQDIQSEAKRFENYEVNENSKSMLLPGVFVMVIFSVSLCWISHIEKYPLTGWKMYNSMRDVSNIRYVKALAYHESGRVERANFEKWIGALQDTRYRRMVKNAQKDPDVCISFFEACAIEANKEAEASDPITAFEVQGWRWNFPEDPQSATHGDLEWRLHHKIVQKA